MDAVVLISDDKPPQLIPVTGGDDALDQHWEHYREMVDSLNRERPNSAKCLLFRNDPSVGSLYRAGNVMAMENTANEIHPE